MSQSVYETPKSNTQAVNGLEWDGYNYKVQDPAKLPSVCVSCGHDRDLICVHKKLNYVHPATLLWIILGPIVLLIAYAVSLKAVNVEFERCQSCHQKKTLWSKLNIATWISFIGFIVLAFVVEGPLRSFCSIMVFVSFFFGLFTLVMQDPGFSVKAHNKPYFYLKGFKNEVAKKFAIKTVKS